MNAPNVFERALRLPSRTIIVEILFLSIVDPEGIYLPVRMHFLFLFRAVNDGTDAIGSKVLTNHPLLSYIFLFLGKEAAIGGIPSPILLT